MRKKQHNLNILERSLSKNARIILPEKNDLRIKKAIDRLLGYGFNVIDIESLESKKNTYKKSICIYNTICSGSYFITTFKIS